MTNKIINDLSSITTNLRDTDKLLVSREGERLNSVELKRLPRPTGNATVYDYNNGVIKKRSSNAGLKVQSNPATLLDVGAVAPTYNATNLTIVADTTKLLRDVTVRTVTHNNTNYSSITWAGNPFVVPADGLFYVPVLIPDYQTLGITPAIQILLQLSDGTNITYSYSTPSYASNDWAFLPVWDNTTALDGAFQRAGGSSTNVSGSIAGKQVTQIAIVMLNVIAGLSWSVGSVTTGKRVKPMIMFTNDVTDDSTWNYLIPALEARGFRGVVRIGGFQENSYTSGKIVNYKQVVAKGHDLNNGSWSRSTLSTATTEPEFAREVLMCHNRAIEYGFNKGLTLFASSGNGLPSHTLTRDFLAKVGYSFAKCSIGTGYFNPLQMGLPTPFLNVFGARTLADLTARYNGLKLCGGLAVHFSHEFVDSGSTGTSILKSDFTSFLDMIKADVDAGLVEVVTVSELENILAN